MGQKSQVPRLLISEPRYIAIFFFYQADRSQRSELSEQRLRTPFIGISPPHRIRERPPGLEKSYPPAFAIKARRPEASPGEL